MLNYQVLHYFAEQLSRRPETVKLLILVSDGQPADTGYYGTAAEEDLRGIKQEYTRKKILFAAAAIGDDKLSIERIYTVMKQISNKEYERYQQYQTDKLHGRILTPDGLRLICAGLDNDPEKIGIHMLEMLAKFRNEGIVD